MKFILSILFVFIAFFSSIAQTTTSESVEGVVSFLTSQNTYVKFFSTNGIIIGDTLYSNINDQSIPVLIVKNLSSTSLVCSQISTIKFSINDKIIAKRRIENKKPEKTKAIKDTIKESADTSVNNVKEKNITHKQKISGRISISNYSNFSNTPAHASYVYNYSLSLNIKNIGNSKLSLESNILFRQENAKSKDVQNKVFDGLKIYNLVLNYDLNKNSFMSIGRKFNPNISNMGALDGLQIGKTFGALFVGGFVGSRPNYIDYGFNFNLFQFGAYFGHNLQTSKRNMQNSIALVEQTNHSKIDRRFIYFQHNSSLLKNVNMFYTLELDLYKYLNNQKQNTVSLTNTYFSLRYRPFKRLTLSGTYDSRKNIIYYETYKDYITTLIEEETRQGFGAQINYNIAKNLFAGVRGGYRFQKSDINPTKNAYAFVSHSNLFKTHISTTLSATLLQTNYLSGNVYNLKFSKGFNSEKIYAGIGYSFVDYKILNAELPLRQHIADVNISTEIIKKLFFSLNFETDFEKPNQFYRLYLQLRKRF